MAAVLCQELLGEDDSPCFQLLLYPPVGGRFPRPAKDLFREGCFLTMELIQWCVGHYLPDYQDADLEAISDPRISPMCFPDLSGLPPCLMVIAGFDPLRDDGWAYAKGLQAAGVQAAVDFYPDQFHGFSALAHFFPEATRANKKMARYLQAFFKSAAG